MAYEIQPFNELPLKTIGDCASEQVMKACIWNLVILSNLIPCMCFYNQHFINPIYKKKFAHFYIIQLKANNLCSLLHNHTYIQSSISLKIKFVIEKPSTKQTKPLRTLV
jgi:hypothetical protein